MQFSAVQSTVSGIHLLEVVAEVVDLGISGHDLHGNRVVDKDTPVDEDFETGTVFAERHSGKWAPATGDVPPMYLEIALVRCVTSRGTLKPGSGKHDTD